MLIEHWQLCGGTCCLTVLIVWGMSAFTHFYNKRLPEGDEEKRDYHPKAWLVVPITMPLWAIVAVISAVLYSLIFGLLLITFTMALILVRKPFIFQWLKEISLKVGRFFLKINTRLLNWALPLPAPAATQA